MRLLALAAYLVVFLVPAHADGFSSGCQPTATEPGVVTDVLVVVTPNPEVFVTPPAGSCSASFSGSATDTIIAEGGKIATFIQGGSASVGGSVNPGDISAFASATASSTPQAYFFLNAAGEPFAVDNNEQAFASASSQGFWTDQFTLVGPPGTNVTLQFTMSLDGTFPTAGDGSAGATDILSVNFANYDLFGTGLKTVDFTGLAGETFTVGDRLSVVASACAGGPAAGGLGCGTGSYVANSSATADVSRTAGLFVEDLTPGTSFTTASGFNYAPAPSTVPEPTSFLLLGSGLLGLGARLGRSKTRQPSATAS